MDNHSQIKLDFSTSQSYRRHRSQRIWQVFLPVFTGVLVMLVVGWLVIRSAAGTDTGGPVSQWADLSMIWLVIPVLIIALAFALLLVGIVYFLAKLLRVLPGFTSQVQFFATSMSTKTSVWMNRLAAPIIVMGSTKAGAKRLLSRIFRRYR